MEPNHPYQPGAEFFLTVKPTSLGPTSTEPIACASVRVKVIHTYKFTRSQTMKVEILASTGDYPLPTHALLKLYDHRYLGDRIGEEARRPWDEEREAKAERIRKLLEEKKGIILGTIPEPPSGISSEEKAWMEQAGDDLSSDTPSEDENSSTEEVEENKYYELLVDTLREISPSELSQWQCENWYRWDVQRLFSTETEAYTVLQTLQGHCIPTFYGETEFDENSPQESGIDTCVRGILIEFLDGLSLEEIEADSRVAVANPQIGQRILDIFTRVTELGILQNDVRPANVIILNDGRVFLIDFAQAKFRGERMFPAKNWTNRVIGWGELDIARWMLDEKQLRDITPPAPIPDPGYIYGSLWEYHKFVRRGREEWREKYYRPARSEDGYEWACKMHKEGLEGRFGFPEWYPIEEKAKERKEILESFRDLALDAL